MGAPLELWLSLGAVFFAGLYEFFDTVPFSHLGDSFYLGGSELVGTCVLASVALFIAVLGDFRGLLLAVVAFALRASWYAFFALLRYLRGMHAMRREPFAKPSVR